MRKKTYLISAAIALGVGGLSAFLSRGGMAAYENINKPPLSPPGIVFPIVWTVLFILMGISSAMIYEKRSENPEEAGGALIIYALQLIVNFFWSIIFFNMRAYLFAFVWLLLLLGLIITMTISFRKLSKTAAYLNFPYILWVIFAGYLAFGVYLLN